MSNCVKPAFANYRLNSAAVTISNFSFFSAYATVNVIGNKNVSTYKVN